MKELSETKASTPQEIERLRRQLEGLKKGNVFPNVSSVIYSVFLGGLFGATGYFKWGLASAILIGVSVAIALVAAQEARYLRKQVDLILLLLDKEAHLSSRE